MRAFITKTKTIILFTNTTSITLSLGKQLSEHFHFRNNEAEDMSVYQSIPVRVELSSHVNTFVGFKLRILRTEI